MSKGQNSSPDLKIIRHRGHESGFTLVELLVVLGVFILLTALTVPTFIETRPQRLLSAEANRMASIMRQGRLFALRDNQKVYMEFIPEIDMYRLWSESGWRSYSDIVDTTQDWDPDAGEYNGDFDGDGDYWWGDSGTPDSPTGNPEDPDVDLADRWLYNDTDGTYLDPDVLLMPSYPGNRPLRTVSPKLRISTAPFNIVRDFGESNAVAGDSIFPFGVDLRMRDFIWAGYESQPIGTRNGVLTHFPLYFLIFFPDGTVAASWDGQDSTDFDDEVRDLTPGRLGATQIHLQVRSEQYNPEAYNLFDPTLVIVGDEGPQEPDSPFNTLSRDDSQSNIYGRILTLNNLSGRIIIRNFKPQELDDLRIDYSIDYF